VVVGCLFGACAAGVQVQVNRLNPHAFPPRVEGTVLDEWKAPPNRPYLALAKLIATKAGDDEEKAVKEAILVRARQLGADGIIMVKADVLQDMGNPRYNTASTLESAGGGNPGFGIQWFAEESSSDSIRFTYYLSVIAIKYQSGNVSDAGIEKVPPSLSPGQFGHKP